MVGSRQNDWDARQELAQLQREMRRLARQARRPAGPRGARVFPSVIVSATDEELIVRAEIPGMKLKEFEISVSGEILTVQGSRITGEGLEGGWYHRRERESGGFSRAIRLPAEVESEQAEASYTAGVLTITLPLRKPAKPRQIPVKVVEA